MLQAKNDFRSERKTKRRIKAAKFALRPTFQDFDFTANRRGGVGQYAESEFQGRGASRSA